VVEAGTTLGPYFVLGPLGAGGMGEVFRARDTRLERDVALKVLPGAFARDPDRLARFRQEALHLATLNHPNIASIYGFEETPEGGVCLVLELVEGKTLGKRLEEGPLPLAEALHVGTQIAEALEVAHERGVIHRDLKPGNVMLGPRGLVKVLDFGLARGRADRGAAAAGAADAGGAGAGGAAAWAGADLDATIATTSDVQGTPGYMSPEQALGGVQDERADVFAFGAVLFECLAGRPAFAGSSALEIVQATLEQAPSFDALPAATPRAVRTLLEKALAKEPTDRLADVKTARLELEEALGIRRAAALRTGEAVETPHNLPRSLTSFVGREQELAACRALLADARLVTLLGMGGTGKSRLAVKLGEDALAAHPDGVWFVDFGAVSDPERVEHAVALALGVREEPGRPLVQNLLEHLQRRRVLLLLDNCEHLLAGAARLAVTLLAACPDVRLLATSREPLAIDGESVYPVPPLSVPREGAAGGAAKFEKFAAVRLYVERARAAAPGFALTDANAAIVGEICRRLDGIPLALELAAARTKVLAVDQIRARLDDRFKLLTGGSRTALPRQQTLRATIQWSHDLLAPREQEFLRRLAPFVGGWSLEGATAVVEENGDEFETLDLLTLLVDKSLVVVDRTDPERPRYRLLESVREFALERLEESGESAAVRDRHLDYYLGLAERSEDELVGPNQGAWFEVLEAENENLLAALSWCGKTAGGGEKGLRLAAAVYRFWSARGHYALGRRALIEALARPRSDGDSAARAKALVRGAGLALAEGDHAAARALIEESLGLYRELGDQKGAARALTGLATVEAYAGDYAASRRYGEECLATYRALGAKRAIGVTLHNLGFLGLAEGDPAKAEPLYEEALQNMRDVGDRDHTALTLADLAIVRARLGRSEEARDAVREAIDLVRELGARREGAYALEGAAEVLAERGGAHESAVLLGAAWALREAIGSPMVAVEQRQRDVLLARLETALGAAAFAAARDEGRALEFEDALERAARSTGAPATA
jgi:non-specific serine/threonine protein kinase